MSSVTLNQFVQEMHDDLYRFSSYWIKNHVASPNHFPMSFDEDDCGMWLEQFEAFRCLYVSEFKRTNPITVQSYKSDEFNQVYGCGHE